MVQRTGAGEEGMTLVEVLAVIVLIGLIMTVVARGIFGKSEAAKAQLNVVKMEKLKQALAEYHLSFNTYPETLDGLIHPSRDVQDSGQLFVPSVENKDLQDIWNREFSYKVENEGRSYSLTSLGSDGQTGGEGPKQDVTLRP